MAALILMTTAIAVVASGCGATRAISGTVDPVAQAATVTSHAAGYRLTGTVDVANSMMSTQGTISGAFDTANHTGVLTAHESVAGRRLSITERISGTTMYMRIPSQPALTRLTGGKPWIKLDFGRALGAFGLSGLTSQSANPTQFVDYLRAVGAKTTRMGTATIGGVPTTHYHVVVNLDNYPKLFPAPRRAAAARGVATMETVLGSHRMPMEVWIDSQKLLRRMSFSFTECVQGQRQTMAMSMNMSNYGPQAVPAAPAAAEAYDLTPLVLNSLKSFKPGTCGPAA